MEAGGIFLVFLGDRVLKPLDCVILDRIELQPTPIVAVNRMDAVDVNEIYLSGLSRPPIALDEISLRRQMRANERRDPLSNALLFRFGEKSSLFTRGSSEILRIKK